jgi:hypothetical protein
MLKLFFPRFSFGNGSITEVKTFHNSRSNLLKENYSLYVTYEQGSLKINAPIQTPKKVTSVTNPVLNIVLLIILTLILLIPTYIFIKLGLYFRTRERLKKDAIVAFLMAIILIAIYLFLLILSISVY